jgi:hypothetical protein
MEPVQSRSSSSNLSELLVFFQPYKSSSTTLAAVAYRLSQSSSTALHESIRSGCSTTIFKSSSSHVYISARDSSFLPASAAKMYKMQLAKNWIMYI